MTDVEFIEKDKRGGISYISHRHGEENNKYITDYYESKPSKDVMYPDAKPL